MARRTMLLLIAALAALLIAAYGAYHYSVVVPGRSHAGALPPLTPEEAALSQRLRRHIEAIGAREHNLDHYDALEDTARYIERTLAGYGFEPGRQVYRARGRDVRNIDVVFAPAGTDPETIVIGAHYDSARGTPGANDNATGTAAVIELARLLADLKTGAPRRLRFVLFVNEERPYFATEEMGSLHYARMLSERGERVTTMYSLETLGYFSSAPGTQRYPAPFGMIFADRGDFVAFVGMLNSRPLLQDTMRSFRSHTAFPSIGGVAPGLIPGIGWSDHWAFARYGYQALMVTDTAPFRYPHYHRPTDTPDKVDTDSLARIVKGMERVVRDRMR
ncbi:MAG: M28 family peptidase [Pseudorhodoplanes sp.]|nr:M28 family peptidase [Pseudorhodoplanes sp.]